MPTAPDHDALIESLIIQRTSFQQLAKSLSLSLTALSALLETPEVKDKLRTLRAMHHLGETLQHEDHQRAARALLVAQMNDRETPPPQQRLAAALILRHQVPDPNAPPPRPRALRSSLPLTPSPTPPLSSSPTPPLSPSSSPPSPPAPTPTALLHTLLTQLKETRPPNALAAIESLDPLLSYRVNEFPVSRSLFLNTLTESGLLNNLDYPCEAKPAQHFDCLPPVAYIGFTITPPNEPPITLEARTVNESLDPDQPDWQLMLIQKPWRDPAAPT